jgi:acetyl-CoA acetyltransferase
MLTYDDGSQAGARHDLRVSWPQSGDTMMTKAAITGLGFSEISRSWVGSSAELAVDACVVALADAGLERSQVDGLLVTHSPIASCSDLGLGFQRTLGLGDLRLLEDVHGQGASSVQMIQTAALAIGAGLATHVLCVFADAVLGTGVPTAEAYAVALSYGELPGWEAAHGLFGAHAAYALAARRHMEQYGTTTEHFAAVAVSARRWAAGNPLAVARDPVTLEDHHASPWIVEPFRRLDCAFPVNGGVAVVVSAHDAAADRQRPPVFVAGVGQGHRANYRRAGGDAEIRTAAGVASRQALEMSGLTLTDLDVCQLYDCFTYATIVTLEGLGFCPAGEGGPFIADGHIDPGGSIPTNTGGGQLSGYYLQGMTPLSEAIIQVRGDGGERQVDGVDVALAAAQGGVMDHHACLVLTTEAAANG